VQMFVELLVGGLALRNLKVFRVNSDEAKTTSVFLHVAPYSERMLQKILESSSGNGQLGPLKRLYLSGQFTTRMGLD
jgi:hypothetical protein